MRSSDLTRAEVRSAASSDSHATAARPRTAARSTIIGPRRSREVAVVDERSRDDGRDHPGLDDHQDGRRHPEEDDEPQERAGRPCVAAETGVDGAHGRRSSARSSTVSST